MALTIGRAGIDVDLTSPRTWNTNGDLVDFEVTVYPDGASAATRVEEQTILVEQLTGMVGSPDTPVVPVTWDAWPAVDGFYEIVDLDLSMVGAALAGAPWQLAGSLRRVSAFASPAVESRLLHARRSGTAVSAGNADPLVGVPGEATVYQRANVGLGGLTSRACALPDGSAGGSVLVQVWADTDAQADATWQVEPADFYEGACQINRGLAAGISAGTRAILGRQTPGALNPNTGWVMGNSLVSVLPSQAIGGTAGTLTILSYAGSAYESAQEISLFISSSNPASDAPSTFSGLSILRNAPEACTVRLGGYTADAAYFTLDLTVRRGDRLVQGLLRSSLEGYLLVGPTSGTYSALTGGAQRSTNDADGNRLVVCSADTVNANGQADTAGTATVLDFGIGHNIGGSSATGIETAQALANQYAAITSERAGIVLP